MISIPDEMETSSFLDEYFWGGAGKVVEEEGQEKIVVETSEGTFTYNVETQGDRKVITLPKNHASWVKAWSRHPEKDPNWRP